MQDIRKIPNLSIYTEGLFLPSVTKEVHLETPFHLNFADFSESFFYIVQYYFLTSTLPG